MDLLEGKEEVESIYKECLKSKMLNVVWGLSKSKPDFLQSWFKRNEYFKKLLNYIKKI